MSRRMALLIGNGRFSADAMLSNLAGPENDVHRLADVLGNPNLGAFDVESLVDQESHTLQRILEQRLNRADRDDLVLLYYSGHGKLDSKGNLCLAAANTTLSELRSTSVSLPFVKGLVDDCRSDRIILVLDCCYSGAASKAFAVRSTVEDQLAATQQQGSGFYILTSSTAVETSRERERDQDGRVLGNFTRCLIEAIESGDADVNQTAETTLTDLQAYLERSIRGQTPGHWAIDARGQIVIARNPRVKAARLPDEILSAISHPVPAVRTSIIGELQGLLVGQNVGLALAAVEALTTLASDDSRRVSAAATQALCDHSQRLALTAPSEVRPVERIQPEVPASTNIPSPSSPDREPRSHQPNAATVPTSAHENTVSVTPSASSEVRPVQPVQPELGASSDEPSPSSADSDQRKGQPARRLVRNPWLISAVGAFVVVTAVGVYYSALRLLERSDSAPSSSRTTIGTQAPPAANQPASKGPGATDRRGATGDTSAQDPLAGLSAVLGSGLTPSIGFHIPDWGIDVTFVTRELSESLGSTVSPGAVVLVVQAGPAQAAGIHAGDVILRMDKDNITTENELRSAVKKLGRGKYRFLIRRGKQDLTVEIDCTACPP